jgi:hypothetical protein
MPGLDGELPRDRALLTFGRSPEQVRPQTDAKGAVRLVERAEPAAVVDPVAAVPKSRGESQRRRSSELMPTPLPPPNLPTPKGRRKARADLELLTRDTVFARWKCHDVPLVTVI